MPVLTKIRIEALNSQLQERYATLSHFMTPRALLSDTEGANGRWQRPAAMRATEGSALELRLAIDDFKTILTELRRIALK